MDINDETTADMAQAQAEEPTRPMTDAEIGFQRGYDAGVNEAFAKVRAENQALYGGAIGGLGVLKPHFYEPRAKRAAVFNSLLENHTRSGHVLFDATNLLYMADAIVRYIDEGVLPVLPTSAGPSAPQPSTDMQPGSPEAFERETYPADGFINDYD